MPLMLSSVLLCWVFCCSCSVFELSSWCGHRLWFCGVVLNLTQLQIDGVHLLYSCIWACVTALCWCCSSVVVAVVDDRKKVSPKKYLTTRTKQKFNQKSAWRRRNIRCKLIRQLVPFLHMDSSCCTLSWIYIDALWNQSNEDLYF